MNVEEWLGLTPWLIGSDGVCELPMPHDQPPLPLHAQAEEEEEASSRAAGTIRVLKGGALGLTRADGSEMVMPLNDLTCDCEPADRGKSSVDEIQHWSQCETTKFRVTGKRKRTTASGGGHGERKRGEGQPRTNTMTHVLLRVLAGREAGKEREENLPPRR